MLMMLFTKNGLKDGNLLQQMIIFQVTVLMVLVMLQELLTLWEVSQIQQWHKLIGLKQKNGIMLLDQILLSQQCQPQITLNLQEKHGLIR